MIPDTRILSDLALGELLQSRARTDDTTVIGIWIGDSLTHDLEARKKGESVNGFEVVDFPTVSDDELQAAILKLKYDFADVVTRLHMMKELPHSEEVKESDWQAAIGHLRGIADMLRATGEYLQAIVESHQTKRMN